MILDLFVKLNDVVNKSNLEGISPEIILKAKQCFTIYINSCVNRKHKRKRDSTKFGELSEKSSSSGQ